MEIEIAHIFLSPAHNFTGHHGKPPGDAPMEEVDAVECVAGSGLRGDRFFNFKDDFKGQATFFSHEVYERLVEQFDLKGVPPSVFRRNIITRGVDLNSLIGEEFEVQGVRFLGTQEAAPCYWMNSAVAEGAEEAMRGNGGLRAKILGGGDAEADAVFGAGVMGVMSRFVGAVLCGGKSRRMGEDKAFLDFRGEVLWRRGIGVLEEAGSERVIVSANGGQAKRMRGEVGEEVVLLEDPPGMDDPLSALVSCLEAAEGMPVVLLAVDMPGMTAGFLRGRLTGGMDGRGGRYFVGSDGRVEPFGALYPVGILELARRRLEEGNFSLTGCLKEAMGLGLMEEVRLEPGEEKLFANLNTPADLREFGHGR